MKTSLVHCTCGFEDILPLNVLLHLRSIHQSMNNKGDPLILILENLILHLVALISISFLSINQIIVPLLGY